MVSGLKAGLSYWHFLANKNDTVVCNDSDKHYQSYHREHAYRLTSGKMNRDYAD